MNLTIFNTLTGKKEEFKPLNPPSVGLYVCGPTVYGDPHLGHARPAITFDLLFRLLKYSGYKVRYVRNITDVGHMESDADEGEDKIAKKARLEQLEPMEVVQHYTIRYHDAMRLLNVLPPSIEPRASGHIIEQIELVKRILQNGYAYESNGSIYFDVEKYHKKYNYGKLSGRVIEDMMSGNRELEGQDEKRNSIDFALWKRATPEHIMRWPSPWGDGFPGWHVECSAMSTKYLGEPFDIHGGGMDLLFPHHECEIAQSVAAGGKEAVRYWMHKNMITINGQKMGKSLGNFITLEELFTGNHKMLDEAYSPMTIRFFILQAHYRSTLDFSNEALQAAGKGLNRLMAAFKLIDRIKPSDKSTVDVNDLSERAFAALYDDMNSPIAIAVLFDWVRIINSAAEGKESTTQSDLKSLKDTFRALTVDILGLQDDADEGSKYAELTGSLIEMILAMRQQAKESKDFATSDRLRDQLTQLGIKIKDRKDGADWEL